MKRLVMLLLLVAMIVPVSGQNTRSIRQRGTAVRRSTTTETTTQNTGGRPSTSTTSTSSSSREQEVNSFLRSLAKNENVSVLTKTPYGDKAMPKIIVNDAGEAFMLTTKTVNVTDPASEDIFTNDENIFPGAIVYADKNLADGHPTLVGLSYGTVDLTINFDTGGKTTYRNIKNDLGTINDTRYKMLRELTGNYAPPVGAASSEESYSSTSKMCLKLGVDANYLKNSVKVNTSTTNEESKIVKIQDFTQKFYTISISEYDDQNLYRYFGNVTAQQLKNKLEGKAIAVISSVTYGRRIYNIDEYYSSDFNFTGSQSVNAGTGSFKINATSEQNITKNSKSSSNRLVILGGSQAPAQNVMRGMTARQALAQEGSLMIGPSNQGVPLSFRARFLSSRKFLMSKPTGSYNETSYVKCPKIVRVKIWNQANTVSDGVKFRLFYNVIAVKGNAQSGYTYQLIKGNGQGEDSYKDSFDRKFGWKKGVEYTLPHSDALKGVSGYTVDDLYVVGPVYYTIRSHTAAGQNWHQDSNGYFDISGGSLYVRMDGNALAGGKGVYIHSATDPKPIGYK